MVHLNLSSKKNTLLPFGSSVILFLLTFSSSLSAEVLTFFNPLNTPQTKIEAQGFMANDPLSIKELFDDWGGKYSPKSGDNIGVEMLRVDMGTVVYKDYYAGYFYQKDILLRSNKGLVDGIHTIKNDIKLSVAQSSDIDLEIEGVERHGMLLSKSLSLIENDQHSLVIGGAAFVSYDVDVQSGSLRGNGTISPDQTYNAAGFADYHFMDNLLYDGWNTPQTYGIGFGFHLGANYENHEYGFTINLLVNDLFSRTYWNNLPHSQVHIETNNKTISDDGYTEYDPTIYGWETYENFTQKISPKYHIDVRKELYDVYEIKIGLDSISYLHVPYISVSKIFDDKRVELLYEHRFHSIGFSYEDKNYKISILSDGLKNASAIGLSGSYVYHF